MATLGLVDADLSARAGEFGKRRTTRGRAAKIRENVPVRPTVALRLPLLCTAALLASR